MSLGAAGITITLRQGQIVVTHSDDCTVLGQKVNAEPGDWEKIIDALIALGIEWNYDREPAKPALPNVVTAYDLGRTAAREGYGSDCNPWHKDAEAPAQCKAWDRGYVAYSVLS